MLVTSSNNAKLTHFLAKVTFLSKATIYFAHQSRFLRTLSCLPMFVKFCSCWMTNTQENRLKERMIYFNLVFQVLGPGMLRQSCDKGMCLASWGTGDTEGWTEDGPEYNINCNIMSPVTNFV